MDERLARIADKAGLTTIQYDIASGDPDAGLSTARIGRVMLRDAKGGSIIVFHMNGNGVHTAEALPIIIEGLRKKGFKLVTVGEMLSASAIRNHSDAAGISLPSSSRGGADSRRRPHETKEGKNK